MAKREDKGERDARESKREKGKDRARVFLARIAGKRNPRDEGNNYDQTKRSERAYYRFFLSS